LEYLGPRIDECLEQNNLVIWTSRPGRGFVQRRWSPSRAGKEG
jgi:hypothetical protein